MTTITDDFDKDNILEDKNLVSCESRNPKKKTVSYNETELSTN